MVRFSHRARACRPRVKTVSRVVVPQPAETGHDRPDRPCWWRSRVRSGGEAGEEGLGAAAVDGFGLAGGVAGVGLQVVVVVAAGFLRGEGPVAAVEDVAWLGEGEQGGQGAGAG